MKKKGCTPQACRYQNHTDSFQIIRLKGNPHRSFERTLLPGQAFRFRASPGARLEIGTHRNARAIVCDRIPCRDLVIT